MCWGASHPSLCRELVRVQSGKPCCRTLARRRSACDHQSDCQARSYRKPTLPNRVLIGRTREYGADVRPLLLIGFVASDRPGAFYDVRMDLLGFLQRTNFGNGLTVTITTPQLLFGRV